VSFDSFRRFAGSYYAVHTPDSPKTTQRRRNCLTLPDHRDAGDQEPDGRREIGDDGGTPPARVVETQVVDGAEVHCRDARNTEHRPDICNPARPSGQHPSGEGCVTRNSEEHRRHNKCSGTVVDQKRSLDQGSDRRGIGLAPKSVEDRAYEPEFPFWTLGSCSVYTSTPFFDPACELNYAVGSGRLTACSETVLRGW
jgi:hypothetical protein